MGDRGVGVWECGSVGDMERRPEVTSDLSTLKFKERWVCFTCRKMTRLLRHVENAKPGVKPDDLQRNCPKCGFAMCNIGSFFAPPPRTNVRRWEAASIVAAAGYHCHSLGASIVFWEIVGADRPCLKQVQDRIARARVQSGVMALQRQKTP